MHVSKIMGVAVAVFVVLSMLAFTPLPVHAESKRVSGDVGSPGNPLVRDGKVDIADIGWLYRAYWTTNKTGGRAGDWGAWNLNADVDGDADKDGKADGKPDGVIDGWDHANVTLSYHNGY